MTPEAAHIQNTNFAPDIVFKMADVLNERFLLGNTLQTSEPLYTAF